ncbi:septal ring lytic transglycosylase RlpA family protein [Hahella sp. HN01]|uniref:septal ring lytic transglycosylase RlpA family protein n=1 Tax=Hahella sp. HN01 TaxID=2847262 RepID=UPI001C1E957B|nr:septal ring lytic transglycosylase RlpA family protein [Hahella sp. HN01]MBU6951852.1 septal ring lytic transglycosylase RlpA family protein [Hahella sp. HN01]
MIRAIRTGQRTRLGLNALTLLMVLLAAGCSTTPSSRYHIQNDRGPDGDVDLSHLKEPTPRKEPRSRGGNKSPYSVWGKTYYVMNTSDGYVEEGVASWYGTKFHGYKTSNGETYNMYDYTAAHKSLPLPTYVRVTNLENGRSVIVRVNDRGPFHGGRLIDLSYAAAKKLGYDKKGTARVRVEVVTEATTPAQVAHAATSKPVVTSAPTPAPTPTPSGAAQGYFLQVGAFSTELGAIKVRNHISSLLDAPVFVSKPETDSIYRVRVGPFVKEEEAARFLDILQRAAYPETMLIKRALNNPSI